jgi:protein TonB
MGSGHRRATPRLGILIAVVASLAVHGLLAVVAALWGGRASAARSAVEVQIVRQVTPAPRREVAPPVAPRPAPARPAATARPRPAPRAIRRVAGQPLAGERPTFGASPRSVASSGGSAVTIPLGGGVDIDPASRGRATSRPVAPPPAVIPAPRPARIRSLPRLLREHKVRYPDEARRLGIEGTVKLDVLIGDDGRVKEARVLAGPGFGLNEAAQRALLSFVFAPAVDSEGKARAHRIVYRYTFQID